VSTKGTMQIRGEVSMSISDDKELEYYAWERQYGREEAILIAAEEWGTSTVLVEQQVKKWDNMLWQ